MTIVSDPVVLAKISAVRKMIVTLYDDQCGWGVGWLRAPINLPDIAPPLVSRHRFITTTDVHNSQMSRIWWVYIKVRRQWESV